MIKNKFLNMMNYNIMNMPMPSSINYMWNFGSLLGLSLILQIISGLFLSFHYSNNILLSFDSLIHIMRDVNYGWLIRLIHMNGASLFFIFIFIHISRGIYFFSFFLNVWYSGMMIFLLLMMTSFLGYILPWGQMSFWGATVITNLLSAIPYLGNSLMKWIWGGFSVDESTLTRFFSLHFILPFVILMMVMIHILFLHELGSSNPLGIPMNLDKISFYPYFLIKDFLGYSIMFLLFISFILMKPFLLLDPDNFMIANSMITPPHIQPEWYFLFAYAILRSIPSKLGGVIGLLFSILILLSLPLYKNEFYKKNIFLKKMLFFTFIFIFVYLTFLGSCPVEYPFVKLSQLFSFLYFFFFLIYPLI